MIEQWIFWFLSGVGYQGSANPLNEVDAAAVLAWIDAYCSTHPLEMIIAAGEKFSDARSR
jgi:hypothetical protein